MTKETLIISGLVLIITSILGLIPGCAKYVQSSWYAILELVVGLIAIGIASIENKSRL